MQGETFMTKAGRYSSGLEKAVSPWSGSAVGLGEELRDHLTQNGFLTLVVATEGHVFGIW